MTEPMDPLKMDAGRELDALIAEKIMGWLNVRFDGEEINVNQHSYTRYPMGWKGEKANRPGWRMTIPHYSTDIVAAWDAWEWLCAWGEQQAEGVEPILLRDEGLPCVALMNWFWDGGVDEESSPTNPGIHRETWPLAICHAALKAAAA